MSLCSEHLTFVDNWEDNQITPSTMRLYSKKVPAREAYRQFVDRARRQVNEHNRLERDAEDVEKICFHIKNGQMQQIVHLKDWNKLLKSQQNLTF